MTISQHTHPNSKHCAQCGLLFNCKSDQIAVCDCSKIELSPKEQTALASQFDDCLCKFCLQKFKDDFQKTDAKRKNVRSTLALLFFTTVFFYTPIAIKAQSYPPAAGLIGSTAIHADSSVFISWATECDIVRSYQNCADTTLGRVSVGIASDALGKALSNGVVSLGDGGMATCRFQHPIRNGAGFDFAVFENGIDDTFLELAFVEVSSDGIQFFRFKSHSLTDTLQQTNAFGSTQAVSINNLAGKYRAGFGTPFDLEELKNISGLDINRVTHVRIIDVVGSINPAYARYDAYQNKINDPWPTPFPSGGFDLDAIGVIYENTVTEVKTMEIEEQIIVYPNPIQSSQLLTASCPKFKRWSIYQLSGKPVLSSLQPSQIIENLPAGIYTLKLESENRSYFTKLLITD